MIADYSNPLVCCAHENANARVVREIQNLDYAAVILEADGLRPSLLLGHVVHAEELIIPK
jgi:hypothetical protein